MRRILLDQGTPRGIRSVLLDCEVRSAFEMGWDRLVNGELIASAESAGFDMLITPDQRIRDQQKLSGRRLTLVVLGTNHWRTIQASLPRLEGAIQTAVQGSYITVPFDRPALVRRPYPPGRR